MFRPWSQNNAGNESNDTGIAHQKEAKLIEINTTSGIPSVVFLDGKHFVSGDKQGEIRCWRVEDGKEVGRPMDAGSAVNNIAVSQDRRWLVSGVDSGLLTVWHANSRTKISELQGHSDRVFAVDVSPDGTRTASGSADKTARVWSLHTGEKIFEWQHNSYVVGVKFSPDGLRIATATWERKSIRVYDCQNDSLLFDIPIRVGSGINQSLVWDSSHKKIFVSSRDSKIYCLDAASGRTITTWNVESGERARIVMARNNRFIVASPVNLFSFWDTDTHLQIGSNIKYTDGIYSAAMSENHDLVAGAENKITIHNLRGILPSHYLVTVGAKVAHSIQFLHDESSVRLLQPSHERIAPHTSNLVNVSPAVLESWREDKLLNVVQLLSLEIKQSDKKENLLATRAILRARLHQWDLAVRNARKSIALKPTVLAYVALSIALFGKGDPDGAKNEFNLLFCHCDGVDMSFMSLIKAIIIFTSGNREEGMARVADLIRLSPAVSLCLTVQAHMYVIARKTYMHNGEYDAVLKLFNGVGGKMLPYFSDDLQFDDISLIFGWIHDSVELWFSLYQQQCEALYALGRQEEAVDVFQIASEDLKDLSETRTEVKKWLQDFSQRCGLSPPAGDSSSVPDARSRRRFGFIPGFLRQS